MRILLLANYAPPHVGGIEVLVEREARLLAEAGHEVRVLTSNCGDGPAPFYPPGVEVQRIPAWNLLEDACGIPWPLFSPALLPALWRNIRWCEMLHAHGFLNLITFLGLLLAALRGGDRRTVLTEHAGRVWYAQRSKRWLQEIAMQTLGRANVQLADLCYACHQSVFELLRALAGRRGEVRFLLFPADSQLFRPRTAADKAAARRRLGWDATRRTVLFVGRLLHRKGLDLLLQAQDPRYHLVICGPGDPAAFGPVDRRRVTFLPPRPQAGLVELYHAADVFVLPSRSEGNLVLVAQEALSCGLPVLLGDDPGLASFRGCPGLHFCPLTAEGIQQALLEILDAERPTGGYRDNPLQDYLPAEGEWVAELTAARSSLV